MVCTVIMRFYVGLLGAAVVSSLDLTCMFSRRHFGDDALNDRWMGQPMSRLHCTVNCVRDERCGGIHFRTSECNASDHISPTNVLWGRIRYYRFKCYRLGTATVMRLSSRMSKTPSHLGPTPMPPIRSHALTTTMLRSEKSKSKSPPAMIPKSHLSTISEVSAPKIVKKSRPFATQLTAITTSASTTPTYTVEETTDSPCAFYNITVTTGTDRGAGTNSVVLLYLLGEQGFLTHELENDDRDDFESGSEDIFQFGDECIGGLVNLTVKVVPRGISPAWQLDRIRVEIRSIRAGEPANITIYTADVNSWLSPDWNLLSRKPDERVLPFLRQGKREESATVQL